jgi:hypothetical protein
MTVPLMILALAVVPQAFIIVLIGPAEYHRLVRKLWRLISHEAAGTRETLRAEREANR